MQTQTSQNIHQLYNPQKQIQLRNQHSKQRIRKQTQAKHNTVQTQTQPIQNHQYKPITQEV